MPKISTKTLRIKEGDIDQTFSIIINYSSGGLGFYAEVPKALGDAFDLLTEQELKELSATLKRGPSYRSEAKRVVKAPTEEGVELAMRTLLVKLLTTSMEKVPVIIISCSDEKDNDLFTNDDKNELNTVSLSLGATYGFKVSVASGKPKYFKYDSYGHRSEVYLGFNENTCIIPDTPENRAFIEDIHAKLHVLAVKLGQFTATPDTFIEAINQRQKLLS